MVILAIHETPSLTHEQVVRRLTGKTRIESPSDLPFDGLLVHAAGQGPNGFCVFDVFESEEAVERFRSAMGTIPQEVGIEEPPQFFPAHTAMSTAIQVAEPARTRYGTEAWNAAASEGSTLSFENAIAYALDEPRAWIHAHREAAT